MQARTHARIALLAVQPADTSDGKGLSPPVSKTLDDLLDVLPDICDHTIECFITRKTGITREAGSQGLLFAFTSHKDNHFITLAVTSKMIGQQQTWQSSM